MTTIVSVKGYNIVFRRRRPVPGARSTPVQKLDWTLDNTYKLNFTTTEQNGSINFIQSVTIDNSYSFVPILLTMGQETLRLKPGYIAQLPVNVALAHEVTIQAAATVSGLVSTGQTCFTNISFGNFIVDGCVWKARVPVWSGNYQTGPRIQKNNKSFIGGTIAGITTGTNVMAAFSTFPVGPTAISLTNVRGVFWATSAPGAANSLGIAITWGGLVGQEISDFVYIPSGSVVPVEIGPYDGGMAALLSTSPALDLVVTGTVTGTIDFTWNATQELIFDI